MKNFTKVITGFSLAVICLTIRATAQDVHFSQFFEAPLLRNPSLAGIFTGDIRFQGVYRSQWGSVTVPYKTGSFNFEYKKPIGQGDDFITTGLQVLYDKAGSTSFTTTNILPALNYHKSLSGEKNSYLSLGFMGGLVQRRIDRSKMTTNSQFGGGGYNPALADGETFINGNYSYLDGSVGMTYNTGLSANPDDNMYLGVAYHHFNRPQNSFYRNPEIELNPKLVFSAGVRMSVTEVSYITIQGDYSRQGNYKEMVAGALFSHKIGADYENPDYTLHLGTFLRWTDAVIPVVKLDYNPFAVALSYDVNISTLKTASQGRGGMELSVTYVGFLDRGNSSKDVIRCPRF